MIRQKRVVPIICVAFASDDQPAKVTSNKKLLVTGCIATSSFLLLVTRCLTSSNKLLVVRHLAITSSDALVTALCDCTYCTELSQK